MDRVVVFAENYEVTEFCYKMVPTLTGDKPVFISNHANLQERWPAKELIPGIVELTIESHPVRNFDNTENNVLSDGTEFEGYSRYPQGLFRADARRYWFALIEKVYGHDISYLGTLNMAKVGQELERLLDFDKIGEEMDS